MMIFLCLFDISGLHNFAFPNARFVYAKRSFWSKASKASSVVCLFSKGKNGALVPTACTFSNMALSPRRNAHFRCHNRHFFKTVLSFRRRAQFMTCGFLLDNCHRETLASKTSTPLKDFGHFRASLPLVAMRMLRFRIFWSFLGLEGALRGADGYVKSVESAASGTVHVVFEKSFAPAPVPEGLLAKAPDKGFKHMKPLEGMRRQSHAVEVSLLRHIGVSHPGESMIEAVVGSAFVTDQAIDGWAEVCMLSLNLMSDFKICYVSH
jgi:hypothetical protein